MATGPIDTSLLKAALADPTATGAAEYIAEFERNMNTTASPDPTVSSVPVVVPVHIATLDELMESHAAVVAKEAADAATLACLVAPTRDGYRAQLFQWAAAGFPDLYIVQTLSVTPPSICADGVTREIGKYVEYCIGKDLGTVVVSLAGLMTGIQPSWSTNGSHINIHVSRSA